MKRNWIGGAFGWLWLAVVLLPIYFVLITSLKSISTYFGSNPVLPSLPLAFENVTAVLEADFTQYLFNSVLVAVGTVIPLVLMAFMASYSLVRGTRRVFSPMRSLFLLGLAIPVQAIAYLVQDLIDHCARELEMVGRSVESLKPFTELPYPRITYKKAIEMLQKSGFDVEYGADFGSPEETYLADQFQKPVFILNYPKEIKAFYMPEDPEDSRQVICADLLAPEGYGEIIGGSERSYDYEYITNKLEENGLSKEDYGWYDDLRKYGSIPHSGFGMGLERFLAWITLQDHIRENIPFPRMLNRLNP